jgi:L-alanine-DL-glutamate epimerase-like enolase superfamily enzyme
MAHITSQNNIPLATGRKAAHRSGVPDAVEADAMDYALARASGCAAGSAARKRSRPWPRPTASASSRTARRDAATSKTAASLQLDACNFNFTIQELPRDPGFAMYKDITNTQIKREGPFLVIPDGPGLGIELLSTRPSACRINPAHWSPDCTSTALFTTIDNEKRVSLRKGKKMKKIALFCVIVIICRSLSFRCGTTA